MTFGELAQLITALAALGAVAMSARNGRKADTAQKSIQEVHLSINSRMDQLLKASSDAAHAEGARQEKADAAAAIVRASVRGEVTIPEQQLKIETPLRKNKSDLA